MDKVAVDQDAGFELCGWVNIGFDVEVLSQECRPFWLRGRYVRRILAVMAILLSFAALSGRAKACIQAVSFDMEDIQYADAVVVGRLKNYAIVEGAIVVIPTNREGVPIGRRRGPFTTKYSRFEIEVDEVLKGRSEKNLTVVWINSTFGEPERMPDGQYLIALRSPPWIDDYPRVFESEPSAVTMLQRSCSGAFLFDAADPAVARARKILLRLQREEDELEAAVREADRKIRRGMDKR